MALILRTSGEIEELKSDPGASWQKFRDALGEPNITFEVVYIPMPKGEVCCNLSNDDTRNHRRKHVHALLVDEDGIAHEKRPNPVASAFAGQPILGDVIAAIVTDFGGDREAWL